MKAVRFQLRVETTVLSLVKSLPWIGVENKHNLKKQQKQIQKTGANPETIILKVRHM